MNGEGRLPTGFHTFACAWQLCLATVPSNCETMQDRPPKESKLSIIEDRRKVDVEV